ncbi:MAG: hypothetical protein ACJ788_14620 [Ktedonobacteraceae bacterium]
MAKQDGPSEAVPNASENAAALSQSTPQDSADIDIEKANVDTLHFNAIGIVGLVAGAAGAVAPLAAMFFNVPLIVTQAGAAVPLVFLVSAIGMVLFYAAVIGGPSGWQGVTGSQGLGNPAIAPGPYYDLATKYVGSWLIPILYITISTSTLAAIISFHNGMVRYLYSFGRESVLPKVFGRTQHTYKSPYVASFTQSIFSILVVLFLALIIQHANSDGSISYAFGFADGKNYQQTNGLFSYGWLASVGTINFIIVYILVNISAPVYARRHGEFNVLTHIVAPALSSLVLLIPLASFVMPAVPGPIGSAFTSLGFAPTPFPLNILPIFPVLWLIIGLVYTQVLSRIDPARFEKLGHIVRGEDQVAPVSSAETSVS